MRDFGFDNANTSAANIAGPRPVVEETPQSPRLEETLAEERLDRESLNEDTSSIRPFHAEAEEEESSNLPKLVGAAIVAVLVVGGGIYAYESSTQTSPKQVAMKTPAPAKMAAQPVAPPPVLPEQNAPVPNAAPLAPEPAPPVKSASETPAPLPEEAPVQTATKAKTPGFGIGPSDDPNIDAPMTYTAENAPPPQQPGTPGRAVASAPAVTPAPGMAMQQPAPSNAGNGAQLGAPAAQLPRPSLQPAQPPAQQPQPAP